MTSYIATLVIYTSIFAILAWSYDLLLGAAGLFSVAHITFYAIGAYAVVLLMTKASFPFPAALLLAIIINAVISGFLGFFTTRLVGDYLVVATLGLHYIVLQGILPNWQDLTGGYFGIFGIPGPNLFGWTATEPWQFASIAAATASAVGLLFFHIGRSRFGLALRAVRDDEVSAASLGYPVAGLKAVAFMTASSVTVLAGAIYAGFIGYIDPPTFDISLVVLVLAMVVVGGSGTISGPLLGAVLLVALPDAIVFISRSSAEQVGPVRQIFYGLALIGFALFRPTGIVRAALPQWRKQLECKREQ